MLEQNNFLPPDLTSEIRGVANTVEYFKTTMLDELGQAHGVNAYVQCMSFFRELLNGGLYRIESSVGQRPTNNHALSTHMGRLAIALKKELADNYLSSNLVEEFSNTEYDPIKYFLEFIAYYANILPKVGNDEVSQEVRLFTTLFHTHTLLIRGSVVEGDNELFTTLATRTVLETLEEGGRLGFEVDMKILIENADNQYRLLRHSENREQDGRDPILQQQHEQPAHQPEQQQQQQKLQKANDLLHKVNIGIKAADTAVDALRAAADPTLHNVRKVAVDSAQL